MAKAKVTSKWVKDNFNCISIAYCNMSNMLWNKNPSYYTCGIYGWNYDVYTIDTEAFPNLAICMGYRGMPCTVKLVTDYRKIVTEYETMARQKIKELSRTKDEDKLEDILDEMLEDCLHNIIIK